MTIEYLAEMLRKREWRGKPITERTVKKYLEAVGTVLEDVRRNDIIFQQSSAAGEAAAF